MPHRCQLAKPGDLKLIGNAEEGRSRFLTDTARDAANHLIKGSHTYTHIHASKHTKELSGSKYQWWRSFQDLSTGKQGQEGAVLLKCTPPQRQLQLQRCAWSVGRSGSQSAQGVRSEPTTRAAPNRTAESTYTCTSIRSQLHRNKLQNLVPQQLRAQDFRAHCACAKARNYDSRVPLASISETPVLSIGYYLACCAWSQRSGWGAQLLNYCCARGLEA